ncbi:MAG TPA: hypothetical protein VK479_00975 [Micropepsaceae bacterium]|nr:hypothetical protein [Micropepsaceae bacterium]
MAGRPQKYYALITFLKNKAKEFRDNGEAHYPMTFKEIEALGVALPPSAYKHRAWWANNKYNSNNPYIEPVEKPWERAKFDTRDVNMERRELTFRYIGGFSAKGLARQKEEKKANDEKSRSWLADWKAKRAKPSSLTPSPARSPHPGMADSGRLYSAENDVSGAADRCRHPAYGALKGYIRLVAGTDLTEPADPEWGERAWGDDTK